MQKPTETQCWDGGEHLWCDQILYYAPREACLIWEEQTCFRCGAWRARSYGTEGYTRYLFPTMFDEMESHGKDDSE